MSYSLPLLWCKNLQIGSRCLLPTWMMRLRDYLFPLTANYLTTKTISDLNLDNSFIMPWVLFLECVFFSHEPTPKLSGFTELNSSLGNYITGEGNTSAGSYCQTFLWVNCLAIYLVGKILNKIFVCFNLYIRFCCTPHYTLKV